MRMMNALKPRAPFQVLVMSEESRLGREAIETAYALKQLVQADVIRVQIVGIDKLDGLRWEAIPVRTVP